MTVCTSSSSSVLDSMAYTPRQQRIVDALRLLLGEAAPALYEAHERSLQRLVGAARNSHLPRDQHLVTGLALAQELLAEELVIAPVPGSPQVVADFLKLHFAGQAHESFVVVFLNAQHHLIAAEAMFRGTLTQTSVHPREVLRRALQHNAGAVILAHNHPSGSPEPSRADEVLTQTLRAALALVDVRVLDHLVVAGSRTVSFAERGLL
jgi:DNA repair protein RadC